MLRVRIFPPLSTGKSKRLLINSIFMDQRSRYLVDPAGPSHFADQADGLEICAAKERGLPRQSTIPTARY